MHNLAIPKDVSDLLYLINNDVIIEKAEMRIDMNMESEGEMEAQKKVQMLVEMERTEDPLPRAHEAPNPFAPPPR